MIRMLGCLTLSQRSLKLSSFLFRFDPWVWKIPWRRAWQSTLVFLPGELHGKRSLEGYGPWSHRGSETCLVWLFQINGVVPYVVLCNQLLSLNIVFLRFIYIDHQYFLPFYFRITFHCINIPYFLYSSVDIH